MTTTRYHIADSDDMSRDDFEAATLDEAFATAREWARWDSDALYTVWHHVRLSLADDPDTSWDITEQIDPDTPPCRQAQHSWTDGPTYGHGGGVTWTSTCAHGCGWTMTTDTWAHDPPTGQQGLKSISYESWDRGAE